MRPQLSGVVPCGFDKSPGDCRHGHDGRTNVSRGGRLRWSNLKNSKEHKRRYRNLDNTLKPLGDLLQPNGIVRNDSDIVEVFAKWERTVRPGFVRLTLRPVLEPEKRMSAEGRRRLAAKARELRLRTFAVQLGALAKLRRGGEQTVRVEHSPCPRRRPSTPRWAMRGGQVQNSEDRGRARRRRIPQRPRRDL